MTLATSRNATGFTASVARDDFIALCEQIRRACGVDLLQYKRGQMERRVRTWASRRGTPTTRLA
jgi:chemotaxis protein methyltransferase CheR